MENHFRVTEAARLIGLSRQRVWKLINASRIRTTEKLGMTVISRAEIERVKKLRNGKSREKKK